MRNETTTAVEREEREEEMAIDIAACRERNNPKKDTVAQETPQFLSREKREGA